MWKTYIARFYWVKQCRSSNNTFLHSAERIFSKKWNIPETSTCSSKQTLNRRDPDINILPCGARFEWTTTGNSQLWCYRFRRPDPISVFVGYRGFRLTVALASRNRPSQVVRMCTSLFWPYLEQLVERIRALTQWASQPERQPKTGDLVWIIKPSSQRGQYPQLALQSWILAAMPLHVLPNWRPTPDVTFAPS